MSDKSGRYEVDYFSYFNKLFETWEKSTNSILDIWFNSPMIERAVEKSTELNSYINGFISRTVETKCRNHGEADNIVEYVASLEQKISDLENKVRELESRKSVSSRTKKTGSNNKKKKEFGTKEK